jgi:lipoprotein-releasing system permease protein
MLSHAKAARGVFLRGVIPGLEKDTTDIAKYVFKGSLEGLSTEPYGIVIGRELSTNLNLYPGDEVTVISPVGDIGPLGMIPKTRNFKVVAVFEVGMFEYDSSLVVTSLKAAQEFFDMGDQVSGIEAKVDDIYLASKVKEEINLKIGYPLFARDWMQMNKNLFAALKLEKLAMFVILTLIVLVAAFNIVSTLTMNVMEKEREIAILKTMGATNGGIMAIFMLQGFLIGLAGTLLGLAGGGALCYALDTYKIIKLPADVYYLSSLPVKINLLDFTVVAVSAILISFFSTVYPAWQAAKLEPVEALRFE